MSLLSLSVRFLLRWNMSATANDTSEDLSRFVGPYKYFKDDISGYLGFGRWPETGSGELASFWTTLQESGQLTSKSVGFYLSRPTSPKPPSRQLGGIVTLGGTNTTLYTGDIEFHELNDIGLNTKYWSANIQST